jgi:hypothetical protein
MHAILQRSTVVFGPMYYGVPEEVLRKQEYCTEGGILSTIIRSLNGQIMSLTCNKSSKSRAASFFISDALLAKRRIVPEPKVGISRKLED